MTRLFTLFASLLVATATTAMAAQGIIDAPRGDTVQMRNGPADAFDLTRLLRPGTPVDLLGNDPSGLWTHVRDPSGAEGWIRATALADPDSGEPARAVHTGRNADRPDHIRRDASGAPRSNSPYTTGTAPTTTDDGRETLYVNSPAAGKLNLRQGPGTDTSVLATLRHGSAVSIIGGAAPWRRVRTEDGMTGYVHDAYLSTAAPDHTAPEPITPAPGRVLETLYVNAPRYGALNLRTGPGTGYDIAETMPQGTRVEILDGGTGPWRYLRSENGTQGYAHADYLSPTRPAAARVAREEYRDGRRVIRVSPQELTGLLAVCAFSGNLDRCMVRQLERRDRR